MRKLFFGQSLKTFESFSGTPSTCNCKLGEECKWSVPIGSCEDTSSCVIPALPGVQSVECTIDNGKCALIILQLIIKFRKNIIFGW